jgi:hypothetical protein
MRDAAVIGIVFGLPCFLAIVLFAGLYLVRRSLTTICLNCGRVVAKTGITEGDRYCIHCEPKDAPPALLPLADRQCHHCGAPLTAGNAVNLWDGHSYRSACLSACPALARLAREQDRLEARLPHSAWVVWRKWFLLLWAATTSIFGTAGFFAGLHGWGGFTGGLLGFLAVQILLAPLASVFAAARSVEVAKRRPTVQVRAGQVRVLYGELDAVEHPLAGCEWFVGSLRYLNSFLAGDAVMIVLPGEDVPAKRLVPVGFDAESRPAWETFLTLAGVRRRPEWEKRFGRGRNALNVTVAVLLLPMSIGAGWLLMFVTTNGVGELTGHNELSRGLGIVFFLPGSVYAILYGMCFWRWSPPELDTLEWPDLSQQPNLVRKMTWLFLGSGGFFALMMMLAHQVTIRTRISYAIAVVFISGLFGYRFGRRLLSRRWKKGSINGGEAVI